MEEKNQGIHYIDGDFD